MKAVYFQNDFSAGMMPENMAGRINSEQYARGAKVLKNVLITAEGAVKKRGGLSKKYIDVTEAQFSTVSGALGGYIIWADITFFNIVPMRQINVVGQANGKTTRAMFVLTVYRTWGTDWGFDYVYLYPKSYGISPHYLNRSVYISVLLRDTTYLDGIPPPQYVEQLAFEKKPIFTAFHEPRIWWDPGTSASATSEYPSPGAAPASHPARGIAYANGYYWVLMPSGSILGANLYRYYAENFLDFRRPSTTSPTPGPTYGVSSNARGFVI